MSWPLVRFGEVARQRKEFVMIDDMSEYVRCRVQLHAQGVVERDRLPGAMIKTKQQQICRAGEFLVAEIDAKHGGYGIVPDALNGAVVSSHYFLFEIDETQLDRQFLDYFARTPAFLDQVNAQGTTNYAAIRPQQVLEYEIPLPPLAEQRRIVAKIERLAGRIEEARGLREQARCTAGVILPSEIGRIMSSIIPKISLGDPAVAEVICGQHLLPNEQAEQGIPYITGPADFDDRQARPSRYARVEKAFCLPGDVLLTVKGAGVGKVNLAPDMPAVIGRQLFAIRPHPQRFDTTFLWYDLQYCLRSLRDAITATTVPGIGRSNVSNLELPLPSIAEQRSIVIYLDGLQAKMDRLKALQAQTAAELDALLPAVLDRAFRGEL